MRAVFLEAPESLLAERRRWGLDRHDEVWEGVLHVAPPPGGPHQNFAGRLYAYLVHHWEPVSGGVVMPERGVSPPGTPDWTKNYRVPDLTLISADRLGIEQETHLAGAPLVVVEIRSPGDRPRPGSAAEGIHPLVVVEIRSPGDETYEKFPFYAALGVPEVWVFERFTREPEVYELAGTEYARRSADADGWLRSPASGVGFRWPLPTPGRVAVRVGDDPASEQVVPNRP